LELPAWLAVSVQVPVARRPTVEPVTEHTEPVLDARETVRPESAELDAVKLPRLSAFDPGSANVIVWDALLTVNDRSTSSAAR
jgi:hypothetical protein